MKITELYIPTTKWDLLKRSVVRIGGCAAPYFLFALLSFSMHAQAQSTFQNLGFESANVTNLPPDNYFVPISDAFPGWTGYVGTNQTTYVGYNGVSAGGALISLIGRNTPYFGDSVIAGNYTAVLAAGQFNSSLEPVAIAQIGLIPETAQSLRFSVGLNNGSGDLVVMFDGQTLPYYPLSAGPNYQVYGADITAFAGLTGELRFTEQLSDRPFGITYLDNIRFSSLSIPEPSTYALLALGLLAFGWWCFSKRR